MKINFINTRGKNSQMVYNRHKYGRGPLRLIFTQT